MKTFNINKTVRIKLTKFGLDKLKKNHENLRKINPSLSKFTPPKVDENGFCQMQLWVVMHTFGEDLYNGTLNLPFEPTIQIDEDQFEN